MHAFNPTKTDLHLIRIGVLKLSPGQWLDLDGQRARFVRVSAAGDLWVTHGTNQKQFRLACEKWLPLNNKQAA
jgi:hypothetical protein